MTTKTLGCFFGQLKVNGIIQDKTIQNAKYVFTYNRKGP